MGTLLAVFLGKAGPFIVTALAVIGGALFGWAKSKSAQAVKAQAQQQVAAAGEQVAQENAQAAQAQTQAVENAADAQQQAQVATPQDIDQKLAALDALRRKP